MKNRLLAGTVLLLYAGVCIGEILRIAKVNPWVAMFLGLLFLFAFALVGLAVKGKK